MPEAARLTLTKHKSAKKTKHHSPIVEYDKLFAAFLAVLFTLMDHTLLNQTLCKRHNYKSLLDVSFVFGSCKVSGMMKFL